MKQVIAVTCCFAVLLFLSSCGISGEKAVPSPQPSSPPLVEAENSGQVYSERQIQITTAQGNAIVFSLNASTAANNLYNQLPLSIEVENYSSNEKIFYLPEKLNTHDAPLAECPVGTLAYYEPWGNVAIFYGDCTGADGLYELGNIVSGIDSVPEMTGGIQIDTVGVSSAPSKAVSSENSTAESKQTQAPDNSISEDDIVRKINVQIGGRTFTATLESNSAADAFVEMMQNAPVVIAMDDYSGFEKVGSLGADLPNDNRRITTQVGDIVLYNGSQIVIFYGSNSWSYTRLGRIDDLSGWQEAMGSGDVTVSFSINK